nr:fimbrillin family protein [Parabacteroides goldsteinii]
MKTTVLMLSGLALLSACADNDISDAPAETRMIRFESGIQTKGGPVTGTQFASGTQVGVYALENPDGGTPVWTDATGGSVNNLLMGNVVCTANGNGGLTYDPAKMYKESAKYSFFGYYPYSTTITAPATGQSPKLACTFQTTPSDQVDYMYATPLENQGSSDNAQVLKFNHALTQVTVKLINGTKKKLTLNSLTIDAPGSATLDISNGTWSSPGALATYHLYGPAAGEEIAANASYLVKGQLMLLPVGSGGTAYTFDMSVTEEGSGGATEKKGLTLTLPSGGMKAGYSYEYTITYGASSIQLSTSVTEWQYVSGPGITVK